MKIGPYHNHKKYLRARAQGRLGSKTGSFTTKMLLFIQFYVGFFFKSTVVILLVKLFNFFLHFLGLFWQH